MAVTQEFLDAVKSKDLIYLRTALVISLKSDCSFKEFEEMLKLVSDINDLYEIHDKKELKDKSFWNNEYIKEITYELLNKNFSKERLFHLKDVISFVSPYVPNSNLENIPLSKQQIRIEPVEIGAVGGAVVGGVVGYASVSNPITAAPIVAGMLLGCVIGASAGLIYSLITRK